MKILIAPITLLTLAIIAALLSGCRTTPSQPSTLVLAVQTYTNAVFATAGSSGPCPGSYQAKTATLTNTVSNTRWFVLPAGKTNFMAVYSGPTNNFPTVRAKRKHDLAVQCGVSPFVWNTTANPLSSGHQFSFEMFFLGTNPPNAGDLATLNVSAMP